MSRTESDMGSHDSSSVILTQNIRLDIFDSQQTSKAADSKAGKNYRLFLQISVWRWGKRANARIFIFRGLENTSFASQVCHYLYCDLLLF